MDSPPFGERRQHGRAEVEVVVLCKDSRSEAVVSLDAENISAGGILVRSNVELEVGQSVTLEFSLPAGFVPLGPSQLSLEGRVVRVQRALKEGPPFELGLSFGELTHQQEESLAKYVRRKNLLDRR
jgi:c-di-GMP-binding flagellar brake protein YcgR